MPDTPAEKFAAALNKHYSMMMEAAHVLAIATATLAIKTYDPVVPAKETSRVVERDKHGRIVAAEKVIKPAGRRDPNVWVKRQMAKVAHDAGKASDAYFVTFENVWKGNKAWKRAELLAKAPTLAEWIEKVDGWLGREGDASSINRINRRCTAIAQHEFEKARAKRQRQAA